MHALTSGSAERAGVAAEIAEQSKRNQYAVALATAGLPSAAFRPAVFEASARKGQALADTEAWLKARLTVRENDEVAADGAASRVREFVAAAAAAIWEHNALMLHAVLVNRSPVVRA